jgi:hypothetical protein
MKFKIQKNRAIPFYKANLDGLYVLDYGSDILTFTG